MQAMSGRIEQETLRLPEPGRSLFEATARGIARMFEHSHGTPGWILDGGTILSARWGHHRESYDIDVKVSTAPQHRRLARRRLDPQWQEEMDRAMQAAGATAKDDRLPYFLLYQFREYQRVEFLESGSPLAFLPPKMASIEGLRAWTARSEQVLAGKLVARAHRILPRDVFDVAAAGRRDPRALQHALGQIAGANALKEMGKAWLAARREVAEEARTAIAKPAMDLVECKEDPVREAIRSMVQCVCRRAAIEYGKGGWKVVTESVGEGAVEHEFGEDLQRAVQKLVLAGGISEQLMLTETDRIRKDGGGEYDPPGKGWGEAGGAELTVDARGMVAARDIGEDFGQIGDIRAAARWAAQRRWISEADIPQWERTLEKERERALAYRKARERGPAPGG